MIEATALTDVAQLVGHCLRSEMLPVQFPVRAYAWVEGSDPGQGTYERQVMDVSLLH